MSTINSFIPFSIHFLEVVRGECPCSSEIQEAIFNKGITLLSKGNEAE